MPFLPPTVELRNHNSAESANTKADGRIRWKVLERLYPQHGGNDSGHGGRAVDERSLPAGEVGVIVRDDLGAEIPAGGGGAYVTAQEAVLGVAAPAVTVFHFVVIHARA